MKDKILIIEHDVPLATSLRHLLEYEGYTVEVAVSADVGMAQAKTGNYDAVVTDLQMPQVSGLEVIRQLHAARPHLPVILMTGRPTTEAAIEAMKLGAYDYILKSADQAYLLDLLKMIEQAMASRRLMEDPVELGEPIASHDAIVGNSRVMQDVYKHIGRVSATAVTVLIRGETGTGKELAARAIYQHSDRSGQPFIPVHCLAIPETLLESEMFGHEAGAFTDAKTRRIGRFEQASGGTIFLDEIGDMTPNTQGKLLRVLQEKTIQRLGGKDPIPVDVRVIAATNRDLEQAIRDHAFREDLYYRLNVAVVTLPPLRERREDILALGKYFVLRHAADLGVTNPSISAEAIACLSDPARLWPGNVRELENVIRKALLLARGYPISREIIEYVLSKTKLPRPSSDPSLAETIAELLARARTGELVNVQNALKDQVERELYAQAIRLAKGNQVKAAKWLGVSRPTIREKLIQYGLHPAQEDRMG